MRSQAGSICENKPPFLPPSICRVTAEKAGISVNTLSRLECGQSSTSINKFRRILLALDADANYLIGMEVSKMKEAGGDEQVFLRFRHLEDGDQKVVAKTMRALLNALEEREK